MQLRIPFAIALLTPTFFRLRFFLKKDHLHPEPKKLIAKTFMRGMVIVIPAGMLEALIEWIIPVPLLTLVVVAPIVEEYFKYRAVKKTIFHHKAFDEPLDGIIYACAVGLGFATFENAFYLRDAYQVGMLWTVAILRAVVSVPGHAVFSSMWGYAMSKMKFSVNLSPKKKKTIIRSGLILSMILHAALNFLATVQIIWALGLVFFVITMRIIFHKKLNKISKISKKTRN